MRRQRSRLRARTGDARDAGTTSDALASRRSPVAAGGLAAVVEHRDIDKLVAPEGALKLSKPADVVTYLTAIFEANKQRQGIPEPDEEQDENNE